MNLSEEIRSKNDIVEVISEYDLHLIRAGKGFKMVCPFHDDTSPSLSISPDTQLFYCFGCGTGGTVIQFVMKYEGLSYGEALRKLADRAGIPMPGSERRSDSTTGITALRKAADFALSFYHREIFNPNNREALDYLHGRGVTNESIKLFKLGYAPESWDKLIEVARRSGIEPERLEAVGVVAKSRDGSRYYDYFRNRVIFPIFDAQGQIAGFSGRSLDGSEPKYINTPETELYHKSRLLYNLHLARGEMRKNRQVVLVEGYMDVVIPFQAGIRNIVASSGTSLTEDQAKLLSRYADEVIIVYDGDSAGINAAMRGLNLLLDENIRVKVVTLPEGVDPDELVRKEGAEGFNRLLANAMGIVDFQIKIASQSGDISRIDVKMEAVQKLLETMSHIENHVELSEYIKRMALELNLSEGAIRAELAKLGVRLAPERIVLERPARPRRSPRERIEKEFLKCILYDPQIIDKVKSRIGYSDLADPVYSKIAGLLWNKSDEETVQDVIDLCDDDELKGVISALLMEANNRYDKSYDLEATAEGCVRKIRQFIIREMQERIRAEYANGLDQTETLKELMELNSLRKE